MTIKSTKNVTFNSGVAGTREGILTGVIESVSWVNDFNCVGANYSYIDTEGKKVFTDAFTVENEKIEELYEAIKGSIPPNGTHREIEKTKFYLAFMYVMSATFGIELEDIELVN